MRKSKLPLKKLYTFVSHFLKRVCPNKQAKKKGRPQKYEDALIITLWLFQILNNYSYRETLEKAKDESFDVPSLCDYHYRVRQLDEKLQMFGSIKQKIGSSFKLLREDLARKASIACAILWNFWVLATYLFLLFLSGILQYSYAKGCGRFLEQPQGKGRKKKFRKEEGFEVVLRWLD